MKLKDKVPFEFLGEEHTGEVIELYESGGRSMALIKSDLDGLKYPIDISHKVEKKTQQKVKKVTKKSKVLSLLESLESDKDGVIKINSKQVKEAGFDFKSDSFYIRTVARQQGYKASEKGDDIILYPKN